MQRRHPSQPRQECKINMDSVPFFGHVLTKDGIQPDESKVKLILDWPIPENQKELQQFMGSVNYLSKFLFFFQTCVPLYSRFLRRIQNSSGQTLTQ